MLTIKQPTGMAPCQKACPAHIDVPRYIRLIAQGDFDQALAVIREKIPFPSVCGYACMQPCESSCNTKLIDDPIAIRALKRFAAEKGKPVEVEPPAPRTAKKVAITGAGPAGLTTAYYLSRLGHTITVFEAQPQPGGMMRWGIPKKRLPENILDAEIEAVKAAGFELRTNVKVESLDELQRQGYDAVLVSTGVPRKTSVGLMGKDAEAVRNWGLTLSNDNTLKIDSETTATNIEGVFAAGDVTTGPTSIINAIASGRKAAIAIDKYLGGNGDITETFTPQEGDVEFFIPPLTLNRVAPPREPASKGAEQTLSEDAAIAEAGRCLRCDIPIVANPDNCCGCLTCAFMCSLSNTGTFNIDRSHIQIERIRGGAEYKITFADECINCGICARYCTHDVLRRERIREALKCN